MDQGRVLPDVQGRIAVVGGSSQEVQQRVAEVLEDQAVDLELRAGGAALFDRLGRLQEMGAALSGCSDAEELDAAAGRAVALVPARFARLVEVREGGALVELGAWPTSARGVCAAGSPSAAVLGGARPFWPGPRASTAARAAALADVAVRLGTDARVVVPIRSGSAPVALELGLGPAPRLDAIERRYLAIAAQTLGGALLHARAAQEVDLAVRFGRDAVKMRAMLDAFSVGVVLISADSEILAINRAAMDLFDVGDGDRPRLAPELFDRVAPAWPHGRTVTLEETPFRRALGGEHVRDELLSLARGRLGRRWVVAGATPLGAPGATQSVVLNVVDVTRCRELEEERAALLRHVIEDIEPGLRGIEAAARATADANDRMPTIVRAARRISGSLHEFKAALSFETGSVRTHPELVDVRAFLLDLLERDFAGVDAARVIPMLPPGLPRGLVDPDHLQEMIVELLRGASSSAPEGAAIVLSADAVGGVRITVAWPGGEVTPTELARGFDRFFRSRGRATGRLHLVRGLAEANGGRVTVASGGGRGLTVHVVLRVRPC